MDRAILNLKSGLHLGKFLFLFLFIGQSLWATAISEQRILLLENKLSALETLLHLSDDHLTSPNQTIEKRLEKIQSKLDQLSRLSPLVLNPNNAPSFTDDHDSSNECTVDVRFTLEKSIGGFGSTKGLFASPQGISGDGVFLFVCDSHNNRIVKTDLNFSTFDSFQELPDLDFSLDHPCSLIVQNNQTILVTDSNNHRLVHYTYEGTFINYIGSLGILSGKFDHPLGLSQDTTKKVYVCDSQNNRIQIFTQEGVFLSEFGRTGSEEETLLAPVSIVVLEDGNLLVSDSGHQSLKVFNGFGTYLKTLFKNQSPFKSPQGLCIDSQGLVYVSDPEANQVVLINAKLQIVLGRITSPLIAPSGIFVWNQHIYITDSVQHKIFDFKRESR